ncbi:MAG: NAD-dependent DNA ligase LigA [Oligoflexales bacterium]|nr:NAD-dependent DNA ligase LigA [Oligoflexales bacterium]
MKKDTKSGKIADLAEKILTYKRAYYSGQALISDFEYDKLEEELLDLDPSHPVLLQVGSPVKNKSSNAIEKENLAKVPHHPPMLSLAKTYSLEDLCEWSKEAPLLASIKVDGVSVAIVYEKGQLILAKTRGDGFFGEEVTKKIRWIKKGLPSSLFFKNKEFKEKWSDIFLNKVEIRGELYCSQDSFFKLALEMDSLSLEKPSNPRNIVAGVLGRKHYEELSRFFGFLAFDLHFENLEENIFSAEFEKASVLEDLGFETPRFQITTGQDQIQDYIEMVKEWVEEDELGIDGVVFSYNDLALHQKLGSTAHHPRYKLSFKWQGETKVSTIQTLKWNTSRLGIVTPVAVIDPVSLSGAMISNVTLHNAAYVKIFNLKSKDKIEIVRSGEVIPKFLRVIESSTERVGEDIPSVCPSCSSPLVYDSVRLLCPNKKSCPAQVLGSILNWIRCVEIDDLSEKRVQYLLDLKLISHSSDLYRLQRADFLMLPATKDKMALKLLDNIQKRKSLPLSRFLNGLGIQGVGKTLWRDLLLVFPTLDALKQASVDQISAINGFGPLRAGQIVTSLEEKRYDIEQLLKAGVEIQALEENRDLVGTSKKNLLGLSFVITGTLSKPREEIVAAIEQAGGKIVESVSKNTSALITDDPDSSSSKAKKARQLNIPIWSEQKLWEFSKEGS